VRTKVLFTLGCAAFVAGCGGSGIALGPRTPQSSPMPAFIRFLNGSPVATDVTVTLTPTALTVSHLAYKSVMPPHFEPLASDMANAFSVTDNVSATTILCKLPYNLAPGAYYTVVIAGSTGKTGNQQLQCQVFNEPYFTATPGQVQIVAHYAAPAFYNPTPGPAVPALQFGHYDPGQTPAPVAVTGGSSDALGSPDITTTFQPAFVGPFPTANGASQSAAFASLSDGQLSIFAAHNGKIDATLLPSGAVLGAGNPGAIPDPNNLFPIAGSATLSVYAIDGSSGGAALVLFGVID
jgi:uncharacterized protein DUF4397